MQFRFVYRTADISSLSLSCLNSAEINISAVRYTNVNGIVNQYFVENFKNNYKNSVFDPKNVKTNEST